MYKDVTFSTRDTYLTNQRNLCANIGRNKNCGGLRTELLKNETRPWTFVTVCKTALIQTIYVCSAVVFHQGEIGFSFFLRKQQLKPASAFVCGFNGRFVFLRLLLVRLLYKRVTFERSTTKWSAATWHVISANGARRTASYIWTEVSFPDRNRTFQSGRFRLVNSVWRFRSRDISVRLWNLAEILH